MTTFDEYVAHELANLLPMIEAAEFAKLKADIAKQGILIPIMPFEGKILDGRNRYKAAKEVGHRFKPENFNEFAGTYDQAHAFVVSTNLQRRQLTNAQKQDFVRKMIEKYPGLSNRRIARDYCGGMSHATIAAVREKMVMPPEVVRFERFKEAWEDLEDGHRAEFVKTFEADIRDLLA
jgi:hypothetical protein